LLSGDEKRALVAHAGLNAATILFGLLAVSGVPELLNALARWHGRNLPDERARALRDAANTLGVEERALLDAELLLDHAGVTLAWIAREAHGPPGGVDGEATHVVTHVRARAEAHLAGYRLDEAAYRAAFRAIELAYRRLFAQRAFLDELRPEIDRVSAERERDIQAIVQQFEAPNSQVSRRLDAEREEKQRLLALVETLVGRLEAQPEGDLAAVLGWVREGGDPAALTEELAAAAAKAEARWRDQEDAATNARADTLRAHRELATLAYWTDTERALAAWRKVAELDPAELPGAGRGRPAGKAQRRARGGGCRLCRRGGAGGTDAGALPTRSRRRGTRRCGWRRASSPTHWRRTSDVTRSSPNWCSAIRRTPSGGATCRRAT
jgi:hypothetical protein